MTLSSSFFKGFNKILVVVCVVVFSFPSIAQITTKADLQDILSGLSQFTRTYTPEKIFLHTDKPDYVSNDTLWYKSYLLDADYLTPARKSKVLYIEIFSADNNFISRRLTALSFGLGSGYLHLNADQFPPGDYVLRAYTNWLKNFDRNYFYERPFRIYGLTNKGLLVSSSAGLQTQGVSQTADVKLKLTDLTGKPFAFQDVSIRVNKGKQRGEINRLATNVDGDVKFSFPFSKETDLKVTNFSLSAGKREEASDLIFPLVLTDIKLIDLQFLPEGGNVLAGIKNKIAFKAIGADGLGKSVSGTILNNKSEIITAFNSDHLGMGAFYLSPLAGESYTALMNFADGSSKSFPLPEAKTAGVLLRVINELDNDSVTVKILASGEFQNQMFSLIGQSRGVGCFAAPVMLRSSESQFKISRATFPHGIARLTILNTDRLPLTERAFFNNRSNLMKLRVETHKASYLNRDSVSMNIVVTDQDSKPVQGVFSVSVTDDNQVNIDSLRTRSLVSDMLLSTELKGHIETPGYYFPAVMTPEIWKHLDNLILTQGWIGYSWEAFKQAKLDTVYPHEDSFSISGTVNNLLGKPISDGKVILFSSKPTEIFQSPSNSSGRFTFRGVRPIDSTIYFVQVRNKNNRNFGLGVLVDSFQSPSYTFPRWKPLPWFFNLDTNRMSTMVNRIATLKQHDKMSGGNLLKEVVIVGRKVIPNSHNLNGPGESDFALSASDLSKVPKLSLRDLLMIKLKMGFYSYQDKYYKLNNQRVHLIIDGLNVNLFDPTDFPTKEMFDPFLDYLSAEDIKGIEIMLRGKNLSSYATTYLVPIEVAKRNELIMYEDHAFIEVTTYSGKGMFMVKVPGTAIFKPEAFSSDQKFYSPKYNASNSPVLPDFRTTVFWSPGVITDKSGKATLSFYTTDKSGSYSVLIEGTNMNGELGSTKSKIKVNSKEPGK